MKNSNECHTERRYDQSISVNADEQTWHAFRDDLFAMEKHWKRTLNLLFENIESHRFSVA